MRIYSLLLAFLLPFTIIKAQQDIVFENHTYVDNIATVSFGSSSLEQSFPILGLGISGQFSLSFDDLDAGVKNYVYTVIHCDRDWTPSDLTTLEYIDGYEEDNIENYWFSSLTRQTYTYYQLSLPNENMSFTKSGNYLLVVYEDEYEKIPVITRRFVIVDHQLSVNAEFVRPSKVDKIHSHQELDFSVNYLNLGTRNPLLELRASVLQNQRWDNALTDIAPKFNRSNEAYFDYQDQIVFPATNEFRTLDLRSLRGTHTDIEFVGVVNGDEVEAIMKPQRTRKKQGTHLAFTDFNGGFVIENFDFRDKNLNSEYANVVFTYQVDQPFLNDDLYLVGDITEWHVKHKYRLEYNPDLSAYEGSFPFKMGYYNYFFATVSSDEKIGFDARCTTDQTEGNYAETENDYLILIYYRPFGSRYDQVVGAHQLNTQSNYLLKNK